MHDVPPPMGAVVLADGTTRFRVWAPRVKEMGLEIIGARTVPMNRNADDVFEARVEGAGHGTDYRFWLDGEKKRPDPCSRWQPHGVHGPSRVVAPSRFAWTDERYRGVAMSELFIYELHVGTFTPEGTFAAIIPHLAHFADLGVTAIELMPVAQFPGNRNWGYDGVFPYAAQESYGGPEGLHALVDAAHGMGIAVVLDVVYNHLGPEGNYLADFGPYFTDRYTTPWGQSLNFDGPDSDEVRRYFRDNAIHWLVDFHVDALRVDAIHSIVDMSARHFLDETVATFHETARELGRAAHIIAESDLNDVRVIQPPEKNGFGFDAQWNDDFHHAVVSVATRARHGYFEDFGAIADIAKAFTEGFVYDGKRSKHRRRRHGKSSASEPGLKFVTFLENHDQVANAWQGKRLARVASPEMQRVMAALLFAQPGPPMIFMGQEFAEIAPFDFFTSHSDADLVEAVRRGRREEHRSMGLSDPPDPQDEATFRASKVDLTRAKRPGHREMLAVYRDLAALRKSHPALSNGRKDLTVVRWSEAPRWIAIERGDERNPRVMILVNFDGETTRIPFGPSAGTWRLTLDTNDPRYGGARSGDAPPTELALEPETMAWVTCPGPGALVYVRSDDAAKSHPFGCSAAAPTGEPR